VNDKRYNTLVYAMDHAIEIFSQIRSSDAQCVAAFDTLKQARAMVVRALQSERRAEEIPALAPAGS
jgi:hypothetical protein